MAAHIEDALIMRIAQYICFEQTIEDFEHIFRVHGPLGSFSGRCEIAALFGIIDDRTYQQLETLRELRNACAHSMHSLMLSDPEMLNVLRRFFAPAGFIEFPEAADASQNRNHNEHVMYGIMRLPIPTDGSSAPAVASYPDLLRGAFILEARLLANTLRYGSRQKAAKTLDAVLKKVEREFSRPPSRGKQKPRPKPGHH